MERKVAIAILKEIVEICTRVGVTQISLKRVTDSEGFELQIENHFDEKDCRRLQDTLQKHNLSMRRYDGNIVIYTQEPI